MRRFGMWSWVVTLATFFASGFAALLYQVIWQRMLVMFSGADVYSATIVVAAFMAGLGVGHMGGGFLADRVSRRTSLLLFGAAELGVALFGLLSGWLYYDVLYQRLGALDLGSAATGIVLLVSLLWPTALMGASLPLLARAMTRSLENAPVSVGMLYGLNTLGAACGAFTATWWLLPTRGMAGSLGVGATLNLACAFAALPLAWLLTRAQQDAAPAREGVAPAPGPPQSFAIWACVYALSGLLALSFEIVWFRLLGVMMKATAFTFGTLLALYLTGLALGALVGSLLAPRFKRPAVVVLLAQAGVGICAAGGLSILLAAAASASLAGYFGSYEPLDIKSQVTRLLKPAGGEGVPWEFLRLYLAVPAFLVLPPTFLMGMTFPVLQRLIHSDMARLGRRVGTLLVSNIVGSLLGAVLTGWVLLDWVGSANVLRILVAACGGLALSACVVAWRAPSAPARPIFAMAAPVAFTLVVLALLAVMPASADLWARLHGTRSHQIVFGEDASGLSLIKLNQPGFAGKQVVFVNGLGQSTIPFGGVHTALGAVPSFVHGNPQEVAIIGLGSGDTAHSAAGHPATERVTCVEIVRQQWTTLEALREVAPYDGLGSLLTNPRVTHVFGDGRAYLMRRNQRYDVIEADALRPGSAYSGNLYSDGYFQLARSRLKPRGVVASWAASGRVRDTFIRVFPHVLVLREVLIGSNEPIRVDREAIARQLAMPDVVDYYEKAGTDIARLVNHYLDSMETIGPDHPRDSLAEINTDLDPRDEFDLGLR